MAGNRAVGNVAGGQGNVLGAVTTPQLEASKTSDTRDPFFKGQGAAQFANYMQPGDTGGALTLDMFSNNFYQNPENIKSVFGTTPHLMGGAMDKYNSYQAEQEAMRKAQEQQNRQQPSLQDYLNQGKTEAQWYAETGRQSDFDQLRKSGGDTRAYAQDVSNRQAGGISSGANQNFTPAYANYTDAKTGAASYQPPRAIQPAQQNANYTSASGQAKYAPPPQQPSLFQKAGSTISNLFKRFFN